MSPEIVEMTLPSAQRSWTLTLAIVLLILLPLALPFPFYNLAQQWIFPMVREQLDQCGIGSICQAATDEIRWAWLLVLGPSILVAGASALLGILGLILARWRPTSSKNRDMLWASAIWGMIWLTLFGCTYLIMISLANIHDL